MSHRILQFIVKSKKNDIFITQLQKYRLFVEINLFNFWNIIDPKLLPTNYFIIGMSNRFFRNCNIKWKNFDAENKWGNTVPTTSWGIYVTFILIPFGTARLKLLNLIFNNNSQEKQLGNCLSSTFLQARIAITRVRWVSTLFANKWLFVSICYNQSWTSGWKWTLLHQAGNCYMSKLPSIILKS